MYNFFLEWVIVLKARLASQQVSSFLLKSAVEVANVTVNGRRFQSATILGAKEDLRRAAEFRTPPLLGLHGATVRRRSPPGHPIFSSGC